MSLQTLLGPLLPAVVAGPFPQYVNVGSQGGPAAAPDLLNRHRGAWASCDQATLHAEHQTSYDPWRACPGLAFVAPPKWRELADARCETCGGTKQGREFPGFDNGGPITPCLRCRRTGRKVHTLTAKKPGWLYDSRKGTHVWRDDRTVSVDVTVRLVPVVDGWSNVVTPECIVIADGNAYWCLGNNAWERGAKEVTVLGDPLTPGDRVAILEPVDPATP